jgi:predicted cytidylate kinase
MSDNLKYRAITISGQVAVGTSTLARNLKEVLGWKYINAGDIQRGYDRKHNINENKQGATARSDEHENEIDEMTKKMLREEKNIIYEGWLAGFMAQGIKDVLKVLVICSEDAIRIDRVANRDKLSISEAKEWLKQREEENTVKWQKLYGKHAFWSPQSGFYDLVIDTYSKGPNETVGAVLDKLGYKNGV